MGGSAWTPGGGRSLLLLDEVPVPDSPIRIRNPKVGEVLLDEEGYYSAVTALTAVPYQYMVQLDDAGVDFTQITEYDLFLSLFPMLGEGDLSLLFGDMPTGGYRVMENPANGEKVLYSPESGTDYIIDELAYMRIAEILRKVNGIEKFRGRPGNEAARKYLVEKERRRQLRRRGKPYDPVLERMVVALVNAPEFKYDYAGAMGLSVYAFHQSFEQVRARIDFDNAMTGVYAGTLDVSKLSDRSCLSWIRPGKGA